MFTATAARKAGLPNARSAASNRPGPGCAYSTRSTYRDKATARAHEAVHLRCAMASLLAAIACRFAPTENARALAVRVLFIVAQPGPCHVPVGTPQLNDDLHQGY
ncbi:hypothetical protein [Massilia sp. S19_KUP03_FR1]|uniref:hypothetical protein n=1 Tax=Massilia sp. S19_KUP03_FR1 TaxID=3025503 RepID=UPI002FCDBE37